MILELKKFETFPIHIDLVDLSVKNDVGIGDIKSIDKTMLGLDIQKSDDNYYCQGRLEADVTLECARCLEPFSQHLKNETDFIATPFKQGGTGPADDEEYVYYDGDLRADLREIVRQTVILALEMKPLCSEDCRGLCPQCGTNLNVKKCKCQTWSIDPRLEPLRDLLQNKKKKRIDIRYATA